MHCTVQCALSLPEGKSHSMDRERRCQSAVKGCVNIWGMDAAPTGHAADMGVLLEPQHEKSVHIQRTLGEDALCELLYAPPALIPHSCQN